MAMDSSRMKRTPKTCCLKVERTVSVFSAEVMASRNHSEEVKPLPSASSFTVAYWESFRRNLTAWRHGGAEEGRVGPSCVGAGKSRWTWTCEDSAALRGI